MEAARSFMECSVMLVMARQGKHTHENPVTLLCELGKLSASMLSV